MHAFRLLPFSSLDVLDIGRSLALASIFPKCSDGLDKSSYSWSDHQWVLTDLLFPVSDPFNKHFPLTGGDSLGLNWCQLCIYSSTQNLHILDYFHISHLLLRKRNKMQPFYRRRLSRHDVNTLFVLCCKFAYEIMLSERRQRN